MMEASLRLPNWMESHCDAGLLITGRAAEADDDDAGLVPLKIDWRARWEDNNDGAGLVGTAVVSPTGPKGVVLQALALAA